MDYVEAGLSVALKVVARLLLLWVPLSALVNLVIDRAFCVPADSAPEWTLFVDAHPRWAGVVKFWRGSGYDVIKLVHGVLMALSGNRMVDPSHRTIPPPSGPEKEDFDA